MVLYPLDASVRKQTFTCNTKTNSHAATAEAYTPLHKRLPQFAALKASREPSLDKNIHFSLKG